MFKVAPLWLMAPKDRVVLRPCRWLVRPQVGVFVRTASIRTGDILIKCRTTMVRSAGGYDIRVPAPTWHSDYHPQKEVYLTFFVSPSCPSIYINCGERGIAAEKSDGNNCDWDVREQRDGSTILVIAATKPLRPWEELLVTYGWKKDQWKAAERCNEVLMRRYLAEVTGEPGYEVYPAAMGPAQNRNPY
jgi:hypothetical protein